MISKEEARVSFGYIHKKYYNPRMVIDEVKHLELLRDYFNQEPQLPNDVENLFDEMLLCNAIYEKEEDIDKFNNLWNKLRTAFESQQQRIKELEEELEQRDKVIKMQHDAIEKSNEREDAIRKIVRQLAVENDNKREWGINEGIADKVLMKLQEVLDK
jgi:hypothetical protein